MSLEVSKRIFIHHFDWFPASWPGTVFYIFFNFLQYIWLYGTALIQGIIFSIVMLVLWLVPDNLKEYLGNERQ